MPRRFRFVKPADPPQQAPPRAPMARRVHNCDPYVWIGLGIVVLALLGLIAYLSL